uniref:Uncharacterized protein n=1 Tax=Parascaris equorum TaxID=6256 RepID=A0A914RVG0_PAREQ
MHCSLFVAAVLSSCLLKPLADANDDLTDDEIDSLPIQLQYHDGQRCCDTLIVHKLVDALYQVN